MHFQYFGRSIADSCNSLMMLSYKISRVAMLPVFIRKTYQIAVTSYLKSLHCKCSSVPVWNSKRLHSEVFKFCEISRGFCSQTSDPGNLSIYQRGVSQDDSLPADTSAPRPFLDLSKSSAGASKNMEDVKRKLSVVINGTEIEMKAVDLYDAVRKMNAHEVSSDEKLFILISSLVQFLVEIIYFQTCLNNPDWYWTMEWFLF